MFGRTEIKDPRVEEREDQEREYGYKTLIQRHLQRGREARQEYLESISTQRENTRFWVLFAIGFALHMLPKCDAQGAEYKDESSPRPVQIDTTLE